MLNTLENLIMNTIDPGTNKKINPIKADTVIQDWTLNILPKREAKISSITKNGPLLLTFIRGTWCPFCNIHLRNLRKWVDKLRNKQATIIVVSSETNEQISKWLESNPIPYLFASDPNYELADHFGVRVPGKTYFQAATFLIDVDQNIRLAYSGKRNSKAFDRIESEIY